MESFNNIVISGAKFVVNFFFSTQSGFLLSSQAQILISMCVCVFEFDIAAVCVCLNLWMF